MCAHLVPDQEATVAARFQAAGVAAAARRVLQQPLEPAGWWAIVSKGAKSGEPYANAISELVFVPLEDPTYPPFPAGLFETDNALPGIPQDEALALVDHFLRLEVGRLQAGVQLHALQWDVLAARICPMRERYTSLKQLCATGLLLEAAGAATHQESGLRWPLTVTDLTVQRARRTRLDARLPLLRRIEDLLADVLGGYPNLAKALLWMVAGGGATKLAEWLAALLRK